MISFQKMLKSMRQMHLMLKMMKLSLTILNTMIKTIMISKLNSMCYFPSFLRITPKHNMVSLNFRKLTTFSVAS